MSTDDNIMNFKGNEAEWAALCALDGIQASSEHFDQDQAPELIDQIWEFVVETCESEEITVPSKELASEKLRAFIRERFS